MVTKPKPRLRPSASIGQVHAHDAVGRDAVDEGLHLFDASRRRAGCRRRACGRAPAADPRGPRRDRRRRPPLARAARAGARRRRAAEARPGKGGRRSTCPPCIEPSSASRAACASCGCRQRHEAEAARASRHPVLRQADADDLAAGRFEELLQDFFRDAVGQTCHEQLRFLIRHAKTHDPPFPIRPRRLHERP